MELTEEPCDCKRPCDRCHGTGLNELRLAVAPYDGPHPYPCVAVKYFLERGIALHEHVAWAISASRSVPKRELKHMLEVAERVVGKVDATLVKEAVLSLIGLWGKPFGTRWRVFHTDCVSDVGNVTTVGELGGQKVLKSHNDNTSLPLDIPLINRIIK